MSVQPWLRITSRLMTAVVAAACAAPAVAGGMPAGFRGLDWGSPVASLGPHPRPVNIPGAPAGVDCFTRKDEPLSIDGIAIDEVVYCYTNGRLYQASINAKAGQYGALMDAFKRKWGEPQTQSSDLARWGRDDDRGSATILATLRGRECRFTIRSTDLFAEIMEAHRKRAP